LDMRVFDSVDGVQPGFGSFQGAAHGSDGRLWFANGFSLQTIDPLHLPSNPIPPPVHIEEVLFDQKSFPPKPDLKFPALTKDLAIRYTGLSFVAPQKVFFRYMLEGQDKTWQDAGTRREAIYTNLGPGTYRFRVIACNNDGLWNSSGDTLIFTIQPAFYQTKWFFALCVSLFLGVLWLLYLIRLKRVRVQIERQLGARLDERERISRELHDTLLQGFHGLILRLQGVAKRVPGEDPTRQMLDSVLDRADEVLQESRQRVQSIREDQGPEGELSEALAACGKEFGENYPSSFLLSVTGTHTTLRPPVFDEVYLIAREALFNAFQHSNASTIHVELTYTSDGLTLRIRDDGSGIDPEILRSGRSGHWGLSGMRERADKIGGCLEIWTQRGSGTMIDLTIPLKGLNGGSRWKPSWLRFHFGRSGGSARSGSQALPSESCCGRRASG